MELFYIGCFMIVEEGECWGFFSCVVSFDEFIGEVCNLVWMIGIGLIYVNMMIKCMFVMEWVMLVEEVIEVEVVV